MIGMVLAGLLAGTAQAQTTIIEPMGSTRPWNRWVEEDLMPSPEISIKLIEDTSGCAVGLACTNGYSSLWILPVSGKSTLYHELGNIFNYAYLLKFPERQEEVSRLLGHPKLPWGWDESAWTTKTGTEYFADAYGLCARLPAFAPAWPYSTGSGMTFGRNMTKTCAYIKGL